ncbi:MAG TPA: DUF3846 domain-containing protein [Ktedonosporobacter sp.]|nr:DUF3846 domain-containing protein [Ktedonosporobacter sp.]
MGLILYPDGTSKQVSPANGDNFRLPELQAIVGGHIELINTRDGRLMVLNDEGKLLDLPRNEQATVLAGFASPAEVTKLLLEHPDIIYIGDLSGEETDYIAGTVLVCNQDEVQ